MTEKFFIALLKLSTAHKNAACKGFAELGLSDGQPKILYILKIRKTAIQKELAEAAGITPPTLSVLLSKMIRDGLVKKESSLLPTGKNSFLISLTQKGEKAAEEVNNFIEIMEETALKGFTEKEKEEIFKIFGKLTENLLK